MLIDIIKIAYGGNGIGRLDGKICFVENALPGETAEIEILSDKKNFISARAIKIESPSDQRENPPCVYYDSCGGCQYQHMSYAEELRWKEIQIRELIQKQIALEDKVFLPIVASDNPLRYRNHITLHKTPSGWGFVDEDNESKTSITACLIAADPINSFLKSETLKTLSTNQERLTIRVGAGEKIITSNEDLFFQHSLWPHSIKNAFTLFFSE